MKACIFDLDGTLADTLESIVYSVNESLERMGLSKISVRECQSFVGNGVRYLMEHALNAAGDNGAAGLEEAVQVYREIFGANCTRHVRPYGGIPDVLEELRKRGIKLAVLSNKPHDQTVHVVHTVFGEDCFDLIQGQTDMIPRKPDPAGVYYLLEKMGVSKDECIYIGDSEVDIATAAAAGVRCISVMWGFRSRQALVEAGAVNMIHTPDEILHHI